MFYFVFEGAYIWRGDLTEGFLRYRFRGLIFGGTYTRRGLFSQFYGIRHRMWLYAYDNFLLARQNQLLNNYENNTNNLLQHSLLILRKKKKKPTVLQSTKRWNQRGTNVVILSEAFCAQTNLFWREMRIL